MVSTAEIRSSTGRLSQYLISSRTACSGVVQAKTFFTAAPLFPRARSSASFPPATFFPTMFLTWPAMMFANTIRSLWSCVVAVLALSAADCGGESGNLFLARPYPKLSVRAKVASVEVQDIRKGVVVSREFDTPILTSPGDNEMRTIALAPETMAALRRRTQKIMRGGHRELAVRILIVDGYAGWRATWTAEYAFARANVEVLVKDTSTGQLLLSAKGKAWGERGYADVRDEEPDRFFQATVLAAFDDAMARESVLKSLALALRDLERSQSGPPLQQLVDGGQQQVQVQGDENAEAAPADTSGKPGRSVPDAGVPD